MMMMSDSGGAAAAAANCTGSGLTWAPAAAAVLSAGGAAAGIAGTAATAAGTAAAAGAAGAANEAAFAAAAARCMSANSWECPGGSGCRAAAGGSSGNCDAVKCCASTISTSESWLLSPLRLPEPPPAAACRPPPVPSAPLQGRAAAAAPTAPARTSAVAAAPCACACAAAGAAAIGRSAGVAWPGLRPSGCLRLAPACCTAGGPPCSRSVAAMAALSCCRRSARRHRCRCLRVLLLTSRLWLLLGASGCCGVSCAGCGARAASAAAPAMDRRPWQQALVKRQWCSHCGCNELSAESRVRNEMRFASKPAIKPARTAANCRLGRLQKLFTCMQGPTCGRLCRAIWRVLSRRTVRCALLCCGACRLALLSCG